MHTLHIPIGKRVHTLPKTTTADSTPPPSARIIQLQPQTNQNHSTPNHSDTVTPMYSKVKFKHFV